MSYRTLIVEFPVESKIRLRFQDVVVAGDKPSDKELVTAAMFSLAKRIEADPVLAAKHFAFTIYEE